MERIASRQNAIVRRFRGLARGTAPPIGRSAGPGGDVEVLLDGAHLLEEALASGVPVEVAAFSERQAGRTDRLAERVEATGARVLRVTDQVLAAMSPVLHPSGAVAIATFRPAGLADVFATPPPLVLVLAGLQDPGNVGATVRTAAACGATGVITIDGSADPLGWKALRGAMGGTFRLPIASHESLPRTIVAAREAGCRLIAAVPRGGTPLPDADLRGPCAVLLGGEGVGLDASLAAAADQRITIPMQRPIESLNVAIAAALILYDASRQRDRLAR